MAFSDIAISDIRDRVEKFRRDFCRLLDAFDRGGEGYLAIAERIAGLDWDELKAEAEDAVVTVAVDLVKHGKAPPAGVEVVDSRWSSRKSELDSRIGDIFNTFRDRRLIHGDYRPFFAKARKRIAKEPPSHEEALALVAGTRNQTA